MAKPLWGTQQMPGKEPVRFDFGSLQLWLKSTSDEFWITHRHVDIDRDGIRRGQTEALPDDTTWQRWTLKKPLDSIKLLPGFPDIPIVVKPEYPFHVTIGVKTRIYVRAPLSVRVVLGSVEIIKLPAIVLSKTWFGNFVDGELCFWISSAARKQIEPDPARPYLAICPIEIINRSDDELLVDKICHRVRKLSLYSLNNQLWSNETRVKYRGASKISEISFSKTAPPEAPKAELISPSQDDAKKGFTAKTFDTLTDLTGLDFLRR